METMDYKLDITVRLDWINPPDNKREQIRRENAQAFINSRVSRFLSNQLNQQNLMNRILGNTGILVGESDD